LLFNVLFIKKEEEEEKDITKIHVQRKKFTLFWFALFTCTETNCPKSEWGSTEKIPPCTSFENYILIQCMLKLNHHFKCNCFYASS
jgi:hypothetical protein